VVVNRRFWIALGLGGFLGAGLVAGFGPYVRAKVRERAERYGVEVSIQHVVPSWDGIRLRGVDASIPEVPGVRVWLDDVVVGWTDRRLVTMKGGRIAAVGELEGLVDDFDRWRASRLSGGGTTSSGRSFELEGFEVHWRAAEAEGSPSAHASEVRLVRGDGRIELGAKELAASAGDLQVRLDAGRVVVVKGGSGYRLAELTSSAAFFEYRLAAPADAPADNEPRRQNGNGTHEAPMAPKGKAAASAAPDAATTAASHRRVKAARRIHAWLVAGGRRVDGLLAPDAKVAVGGTRAKLGVGKDVLNLGPGTLRVEREAEELVVALEPDVAVKADSALTFSTRIPLLAEGVDPKAITARLRGGPIALSLLGIKEGDLGLTAVDRASVESDVRVVLAPSGESLTIKGSGKLRQLSLASKRLAAETLSDMELAWRVDAEARIDGTSLVVRDAELDLGDLRLLVSGSYQRHDAGHRLDIEYEVPLTSCERAFGSLPRAMVPNLEGLRFAGSLAFKGHARFDTVALDRSYDVDWEASNSCRVVEAPAALNPGRFQNAFDKLVYSPEGKESRMKFGPSTDTWVPRTEISRYMEGAVLTTEDGRFFRHHGFDKEAIINSIRENIRSGRFVRGASTISMQLAKNLYLPRTKTISRKLQEAVLTMYLEQELTKEQMMELYLNVIEFGPMVYGIGPAARHYFNTTPARLSLGQSLYLASILSNPNKQYFTAGGAVAPGRMGYLKTLMKVVHKIGRISDEELERGLRETVVRGSPAPLVAPEEESADGGDPLEQTPPPADG
jgi:hypothetical protein